jgi:hypothetical protein
LIPVEYGVNENEYLLPKAWEPRMPHVLANGNSYATVENRATADVLHSMIVRLADLINT